MLQAALYGNPTVEALAKHLKRSTAQERIRYIAPCLKRAYSGVRPDTAFRMP